MADSLRRPNFPTVDGIKAPEAAIVAAKAFLNVGRIANPPYISRGRPAKNP
jgi:hypothetical protein